MILFVSWPFVKQLNTLRSEGHSGVIRVNTLLVVLIFSNEVDDSVNEWGVNQRDNNLAKISNYD